MTLIEIEELFYNEVKKKDFKKRSGLDKQVVYNYRNRKKPTIGTMLEVLLLIGSIEVKKNESTIKS